MSIEQVARMCGLPPLQAQLAKQRDYVEPFRIVDPSPVARARLWKALERVNLRCTRGESFDWVGSPVDVDVSVTVLRGLYRRVNPAVMTACVAQASGHDILRDILDCDLLVRCDAGTAIDAAGWVGAIAETVRQLRRRREGAADSGPQAPLRGLP
jgi:hypothetical protein